MKSIKHILFELAHSEELAEQERAMKTKLEALVEEMHLGGILYSEAVREFKKRFVLQVINHRTIRGNQCKAARELGMHRNTFSRATRELELQKGPHGHWGDRAEASSRKQAGKVEPVSVEVRQA